MNLIEVALARVILEKNKPEITNAMKVFHYIYKNKQLNTEDGFTLIEIFESFGDSISLSDIFESLNYLYRNNLILLQKEKYFIPNLIDSMNKLIELNENEIINKEKYSEKIEALV